MADDVVFKTGCTIQVGKWAMDPCWRCDRQPTPAEVVQIDMMAQTVTCAVCHGEDNRVMAEALARSLTQLRRQHEDD